MGENKSQSGARCGERRAFGHYLCCQHTGEVSQRGGGVFRLPGIPLFFDWCHNSGCGAKKVPGPGTNWGRVPIVPQVAGHADGVGLDRDA